MAVDISPYFNDNQSTLLVLMVDNMSSIVFCSKLQQELPRLTHAPFPGPLGKRIHEEVSQKAWDMWINHQTMLVNEYRLSMIDPQAREFLREEMEKFFFGNGCEKPSGYVPKE